MARRNRKVAEHEALTGENEGAAPERAQEREAVPNTPPESEPTGPMPELHTEIAAAGPSPDAVSDREKRETAGHQVGGSEAAGQAPETAPDSESVMTGRSPETATDIDSDGPGQVPESAPNDDAAGQTAEDGGEDLSDAELNRMIEELCESKAAELRLLGYEQVRGEDVWACVSDGYRKTGMPPLYQVINDILSLKPTRFMNYITLNMYRGEGL